MRYVGILVEGPTEESFVNNVLNPHFESQRIYLEAIVIPTSRGNKGGGIEYQRVKFNIRQLLKRSYLALVTTMIDFYGLGKDFPGWKTMKGTCYQKVAQLEKAMDDDIGHRKFHPYLALHEFEALLFSKPEMIAREQIGDNQRVADALKAVRQGVDSPEEINLDKPPSKRILELIPGYRKVSTGVSIAHEIGLEAMREQCPHFDQWMRTLETL